MKHAPALVFAALLLLVSASPFTRAQEAAAPAPGKGAAEKLEDIPAAEMDKLRELAGQKVAVVGEIKNTGRSESGINFLNFDGGFVVVCFPEVVKDKFPDKDPAKLYHRKYVRVTGEITLFKDKPQIKLYGPDQVEEIDRPVGDEKPKGETKDGETKDAGAKGKDAKPEKKTPKRPDNTPGETVDADQYFKKK
ncbi:MAG: hypothetical protein R3F11_13230 [Verrucomicrobiales bacterium]